MRNPHKFKPFAALTALAAAALLALFMTPANAEMTVAKEGAELGKWTMDYDAAKALADEKDLPLFLNFTGSDWCGWCKLMDQKVFSTDAWKEYADKNLVLVTLDFPQDEEIVPEKYKARNEKLQEQFAVQGFPTFVLLSADENEEVGRLGASQDATPEAFIRDIRMQLRRNTDAGLNAYTSQLSDEQATAYKEASKALQKAETELKTWIMTQPQPNEENMAKFQTFQNELSSLEQQLRDIEVAHLVSTLPDEKASKVKELYASMKESSKKLQEWLMTQPENTQENQEKLREMTTKVEALEKQLSAYE